MTIIRGVWRNGKHDIEVSKHDDHEEHDDKGDLSEEGGAITWSSMLIRPSVRFTR